MPGYTSARRWLISGFWPLGKHSRYRLRRHRLPDTFTPLTREQRELRAARCFALTIANASWPEESLSVLRVATMCETVEGLFDQLSHPKGQDEIEIVQYLRKRHFRLTSASSLADNLTGEGKLRTAADTLLTTAYLLWKDALSNRRLRDKLEQRASVLADSAEGLPKKIFLRVIKDALWEAEVGDGKHTVQNLRKWKGVFDVSLKILSPRQDQDRERCTLEHFRKVADYIRENLPHDHNLPREWNKVAQLFYEFYPLCGEVARLDDDFGAAETDRDALMEIMSRIPPELADSLLRAFKDAISKLPPRDQVILSNVLGTFAVVGREAKRAYRDRDLGEKTISDKDRIAQILGLTQEELARELQRMDVWLDDIGSQLQQNLLQRKGDV